MADKKNVEAELFNSALQQHKASNFEQAEGLYRKVLQNNPRHVGALTNLAVLALRFNWLDVARKLLERALEVDSDYPDALHILGLTLYQQGQQTQAIASIKRALELNPGLETAKDDIRRIEKDIRLASDPDYSAPTDAPWDDKVPIWQESAGSDTLFVLFSGLGVGREPPAFIFHNFLKPYSGIDKLFVRDLSRSWYFKGMSGLSSDIDSTAEFLETLTGRYSRTVFVGSSAGGMAAILFGEILNADKVLAFAPQTVLSAPKKQELKDYRWHQFLSTFTTEVKEPRYLDLKNLNPFDAKIDIYFSSGDKHDILHANRVQGSRVNHFEYESDDHFIALHLRDNGELKMIMESEMPDGQSRGNSTS
jgi:hypothetical protein